MSTSAVLNLIAPSAPLPVQAAGDADASTFGGLLSDIAASETSTDHGVPPQPTTQPLRETSKAVSKTVALDEITPGTLIDPTGLGVIQTLPPAPGNEGLVTKTQDTALTFPGPAADGGSEPATPDVALKTADQPPVMPLPGVPTPAVPVVSPATSKAGQTATTTLVLPDVPAADTADDAMLAAAAKAATDDVQTLPPAAPDKTAATTTPVPQVQPAAPPPLKPASERTGRNADSLTHEGGDAGTSSDGVKPAAVPAPNAAVASASTTGKTPADIATPALTIGQRTAEADPSGDLGPDGAATSHDTTRTQAQAAVIHDTSLSTLSRATIDATAQIAAQIIRKLDGKSTRFEMALTPDDLGRVDVKLEIDAEGRLAARMAFDNPAAAADLRGRADELRRQLQDAGFHVPDDAFEFAERDSGSSAFDRGASDQNDNQRQNRAFTAASRLNAETDVAQPPRWMSLSLRPSGVDLKV